MFEVEFLKFKEDIYAHVLQVAEQTADTRG